MPVRKAAGMVMDMLSFRNDYSEGAHPSVLEALTRTNMEQTIGYGLDTYCARAADTIRALCAAPEADVQFLVGGTQINKTAIGAFLQSYEAAIAAQSGHISVHETGAIEHNGHKVIHIPTMDGKLSPALLAPVLAGHSREHMVAPRLVYISNTTELGTVYSREELAALSGFCRKNSLLLYCDGARLGSAIAAGNTDFADYSAFCDAFTIGGTKNGLLFGEALVIVHSAIRSHFRWHMKQQGAILAKGRLLGIQFSAILEEGLYLELARHANTMADRVRAGLPALGIRTLVESNSNQVFIILPEDKAEKLAANCAFEFWDGAADGFRCVRLITSWATLESDVDALLELLGSL